MKVKIGRSPDGNTFIIGQESSTIDRIFIEGSQQIGSNEFETTLGKMGYCGHISSNDIQRSLNEICNPESVY